MNIKNTQKQIKGLEFVFIELTKFKPQNRAEQKLHDLWLRFLTEINESTREAPKELLENSDTREAVQYMEVGTYTKEQLVTYAGQTHFNLLGFSINIRYSIRHQVFFL